MIQDVELTSNQLENIEKMLKSLDNMGSAGLTGFIVIKTFLPSHIAIFRLILISAIPQTII
jgi:hypothetical protein